MAVVDDYIAAVLATGPEAFWPMQDASGGIVDETGNGYDGAELGDTEWLGYQETGPCEEMYSIGFSEANDAVFRVENFPRWASPTAFSVAAVVMRPDLYDDTTGHIASVGVGNFYQYEWLFNASDTGDTWKPLPGWGLTVAGLEGVHNIAVTPRSTLPCRWVSMVSTFDGSAGSQGEGRCYLDGVLRAVSAVGHPPPGSARATYPTAATWVVIGGSSNNSMGAVGRFHGRMCMVAFWDRVVSEAEVAAMWDVLPHGCGIGCPDLSRPLGWKLDII